MRLTSKFRLSDNRPRRHRFAVLQLEVLEDRLQPGSLLLGQEWGLLASNLMEPDPALGASVNDGARASHFRPVVGNEHSRPSATSATAVLTAGGRTTDYRSAAQPAIPSGSAYNSAPLVLDDRLAPSPAKQVLATPAATASHAATMNRPLPAGRLTPVQATVPLISQQAELSAVPTHVQVQQQPGGDASQNWATYVTGTTTSATGRAVVLDGNGNSYVTGSTDEVTTKKAFVAKYDPTGVQLFLTKFQAQDVSTNVPYNHSEGHAIALDGNGNIYVSGKTTNATSRHADGFVMRFDGSGNVDTSYGVGFDSGPGGGDVSGDGIAVTPDGTATITGTARFLGNDVFVAQVAVNGAVNYGNAFLAPSFQGTDFRATFGNAIALSTDGTAAYISGKGTHLNGDNDVMVMLVDPTSGIPSGFSFASNPGDDSGNGIVVGGPNGTVYQTGTQTITVGGSTQTYAIAINWSADLKTTFYGVYEPNTTTGTGIAVDPTGNIYVTGTALDLFGNSRALVDELDSAAAIADTLLIADNGSGQEAGYGIAFSQDGTVCVTGYTTSSNLATDGSSLNGDQDAFLANVGGFLN